MANRWFTQFYGTLHKKPVLLDCSFKVLASDSAKNGILAGSLKGPGIANVWMHSSVSVVGDTHTSTAVDAIASTSGLAVGDKISGSGIPAGTTIAAIVSSTAITLSAAATATATGVTLTVASASNPQPASGIIIVNLQDNFNKYFFGGWSSLSPLSGSNINISTGSSLTAGTPYVITSVGTTTAAQWQAVGVPVGITAAVGVSFIAKATSGSGTGVVQTVTSSGVANIEVVGDPNTTIVSSAATVMGVSSGAYVMLKCFDYAGALVAPAANSTMQLSFYLSNSSITVQGE